MRDRALEKEFIDKAERMANAEGYAEHVHSRLQDGERLYGYAYFGFPLAKCIREIREEAFDIGAYSSLLVQHPDLHGSLVDVANVQTLLLEATAHAVKINAILDAVKDQLV